MGIRLTQKGLEALEQFLREHVKPELIPESVHPADLHPWVEEADANLKITGRVFVTVTSDMHKALPAGCLSAEASYFFFPDEYEEDTHHG